MDPQRFVAIYGLLVLLLILSFWQLRKGTKKPSKLRFDKEKSSSQSMAPQGEVGVEVLDASEAIPSEVELNVFFMYNGHSWDAYEVLGVPAGSSLEAVKTAHQKEVAESTDAKEFYDLALQAIEKKKS